LHSPIFIRYSQFQFEVFIEEGKLQFLENSRKKEDKILLENPQNPPVLFSKQNQYLDNLFNRAENGVQSVDDRNSFHYQSVFLKNEVNETKRLTKNLVQDSEAIEDLNKKQSIFRTNVLDDWNRQQNGFLFKRSFDIWKKIETNNKKIYFFTSFGILIGYKKNYQNVELYNITDVFLETTPGRLIFSLNYKNTYLGTMN